MRMFALRQGLAERTTGTVLLHCEDCETRAVTQQQGKQTSQIEKLNYGPGVALIIKFLNRFEYWARRKNSAGHP